MKYWIVIWFFVLVISANSANVLADDSSGIVAPTSDLRACGMKWHRDEQKPKGVYSVWRPTRPVQIIVTLARGGKVVGSQVINLRPPNQEISLLTNTNGQDYDGVHSCTVTW